jgi:hypothetical protein
MCVGPLGPRTKHQPSTFTQQQKDKKGQEREREKKKKKKRQQPTKMYEAQWGEKTDARQRQNESAKGKSIRTRR